VATDCFVDFYTYVDNDPYGETDPTGEAAEQIEEIVVKAARPPPPPPPSSTLTEIVVTARAVSKVELAEPFVLNPIGLLILGPFIPGNMGHAACEDTGTCNDGDTTTMDSRRDYVPNKPGRKKQGREGGEKKRGKDGWKPRNPLREPPPHTPSQKD
jgi:hypothetical protein